MFNKKFFQAAATLIGTIIGVGFFSLPYITVRVGFEVILCYFLLIGTIIFIVNLFYGEIVLRTKGKKRLIGYASKYLGEWGRKLTLISLGAGLIGALLAYLIVGGGFLSSFLKPFFGGSDLVYTLIFFLAGAFLIYFGTKSIALVEFFGLILFFIAFLFIFFYGLPLVNLDNLFTFNTSYLFLPYGAIFFSLCGFSLIPEAKELLGQSRGDLKGVLFLSVLVPALVYLLFIILVVGLTGQQTSLEAIAGLKNVLDSRLVGLFLVFGILATFTSFLTLGLTLEKVFWYDLGLGKTPSWFLACGIPLILFFLGFKDFIAVISLTGGVALSLDATIITLAYLKSKTKGDLEPAYNLSIPRPLVYSMIVFFVLAAIYEIYYFIQR